MNLESESYLPPLCERCLGANSLLNSTLCRGCSDTVDRIIARAADGELTDTELADMLDLTLEAIWQRRTRMRKRGQPKAPPAKIDRTSERQARLAAARAWREQKLKERTRGIE